MPTLQIEMANTNRSQSVALESFRNETVKGQHTFNQILASGINKKLIGKE
jgi:hypothetical protein